MAAPARRWRAAVASPGQLLTSARGVFGVVSQRLEARRTMAQRSSLLKQSPAKLDATHLYALASRRQQQRELEGLQLESRICWARREVRGSASRTGMQDRQWEGNVPGDQGRRRRDQGTPDFVCPDPAWRSVCVAGAYGMHPRLSEQIAFCPPCRRALGSSASICKVISSHKNPPYGSGSDPRRRRRVAHPFLPVRSLGELRPSLLAWTGPVGCNASTRMTEGVEG